MADRCGCAQHSQCTRVRHPPGPEPNPLAAFPIWLWACLSMSTGQDCFSECVARPQTDNPRHCSSQGHRHSLAPAFAPRNAPWKLLNLSMHQCFLSLPMAGPKEILGSWTQTTKQVYRKRHQGMRRNITINPFSCGPLPLLGPHEVRRSGPETPPMVVYM